MNCIADPIYHHHVTWTSPPVIFSFKAAAGQMLWALCSSLLWAALRFRLGCVRASGSVLSCQNRSALFLALLSPSCLPADILPLASPSSSQPSPLFAGPSAHVSPMSLSRVLSLFTSALKQPHSAGIQHAPAFPPRLSSINREVGFAADSLGGLLQSSAS